MRHHLLLLVPALLLAQQPLPRPTKPFIEYVIELPEAKLPLAWLAKEPAVLDLRLAGYAYDLVAHPQGQWKVSLSRVVDRRTVLETVAEGPGWPTAEQLKQALGVEETRVEGLERKLRQDPDCLEAWALLALAQGERLEGWLQASNLDNLPWAQRKGKLPDQVLDPIWNGLAQAFGALASEPELLEWDPLPELCRLPYRAAAVPSPVPAQLLGSKVLRFGTQLRDRLRQSPSEGRLWRALLRLDFLGRIDLQDLLKDLHHPPLEPIGLHRWSLPQQAMGRARLQGKTGPMDRAEAQAWLEELDRIRAHNLDPRVAAGRPAAYGAEQWNHWIGASMGVLEAADQPDEARRRFEEAAQHLGDQLDPRIFNRYGSFWIARALVPPTRPSGPEPTPFQRALMPVLKKVAGAGPSAPPPRALQMQLFP